MSLPPRDGTILNAECVDLSGQDPTTPRVGFREIQQIARELSVNTTTTQLFLQNNQLGDICTATLAPALMANRTLAVLRYGSLFGTCTWSRAQRFEPGHRRRRCRDGYLSSKKSRPLNAHA